MLSKRNVFFDVSTIKGGEHFEKRIVLEIARSDAVLVFIGKRWLESSQDGGGARIWEADDYVRAEIRAALNRPVFVLPILVEGASMPLPDLLPEDIKAITTRNALLLRHERFEDDAENIISTALGIPARGRPWDDRGKLFTKVGYSVGGAFVAFSLLAVGAVVHLWILKRPLSASIGNSATTLLLMIGVIFGVAMGLRYEARKERR
jgi:hypothetical protein